MNKILLATSLFFFALSCAAQEQPTFPNSQNTPTNTQSSQDELEKIKQELDGLKIQVNILEYALKDIRMRLPGSVTLAPDSEGFSVLNPGVGQISVSFMSIKPYASGSEFTIGAVNLSSVTLTEVQFAGSVFSTEGQKNEKIQPQYKGKSGFSLPSGKQVKLTFRVPLISPDKFKEVNLDSFVGGISYRVGK